MTLVTVDASVAACWLLPDEASAQADTLFAQARAGAVVFQAPGLWAWETGNLLQMAVRRKRLDERLRREALDLLAQITIALDAPPGRERMEQTLALAGRGDLTFYDASYLELALRTDARLATKDAALRRAARAAGVECVAL